MKRVILREIWFSDSLSGPYKGGFSMSHGDCCSLIRRELRECVTANCVMLASESRRDPVNQCTVVYIFAKVPDSLATFYMLKYGAPEPELIYS